MLPKSFMRILLATVTICIVHGTIDLNIHQLRFVADHLSDRECRRLVELLHSKYQDVKVKRIHGYNEPRKPCLTLLLRWDRRGGRGKTFHELALRLRQLRHNALADQLSRSVYHEKAAALNKAFLKDPFKKLVPKNSLLLGEKKLDEKKIDKMVAKKYRKSGRPDAWSAPQILFIVTGSVAFILLFFLVSRKVFPGCWRNIWESMCSEKVVKYLDKKQEKLGKWGNKFRVNLNKHLLGAEEGTK